MPTKRPPSDIPLGASTSDVTHPLVLRDHMKTENHFTFTATISMARKLGRMVN